MKTSKCLVSTVSLFLLFQTTPANAVNEFDSAMFAICGLKGLKLNEVETMKVSCYGTNICNPEDMQATIVQYVPLPSDDQFLNSFLMETENKAMLYSCSYPDVKIASTKEICSIPLQCDRIDTSQW